LLPGLTMDVLRRLFARKSTPVNQPEAPVLQAPEPVDIDAATVLLDLAQRRDVDQMLRVLDAHLERIQEQGRESEVLPLLRWAEDALEQTAATQPAHYALLGNINQRLSGAVIAQPHRRALDFYTVALAGFQQAREAEGVAVVQNNMGMAYLDMAVADPGNYCDAIPLLEEALLFYERGEDWSRRADICLSLGEAYLGLEESGCDHFELGREYMERARALYERCGDAAGQAQAQGRLGDVQMQLAAFDRDQAREKAVRHYRNALSIYVDLGDDRAMARYQDKLSRAYGSQGEEEHLRKGLRAGLRALELYEEQGDKPAIAAVCQRLGDVQLALVGHGDEAVMWSAFESLRRGLGLYRELGDRLGRAQCLLGLAEIYLAGGDERQDADLNQGLGCLEEALAVYRGEGDHAAVAAVEARLDKARIGGD